MLNSCTNFLLNYVLFYLGIRNFATLKIIWLLITDWFLCNVYYKNGLEQAPNCLSLENCLAFWVLLIKACTLHKVTKNQETPRQMSMLSKFGFKCNLNVGNVKHVWFPSNGTGIHSIGIPILLSHSFSEIPCLIIYYFLNW